MQVGVLIVERRRICWNWRSIIAPCGSRRVSILDILLSVAAIYAIAEAAGALAIPSRTTILRAMAHWLPPWAVLDGIPEGISPYTLWLGLFLSGLVAPIVEELYFRAFLMPRIPVSGRWAEGCHSLKQLLSELQPQGFTGSYASLSRAVHGRLGIGDLKKGPSPARPKMTCSPRQAAWYVLRSPDSLKEHQKAFRQALCTGTTSAAYACQLAQAFQDMLAKRQSEKLDEWLNRAERSPIAEFQRFAVGLRTDYAAVKAAFDQPWSNGQVEGQVNRLKLIKRQMYGRANFGLLRKRVLGFR